VYFEAALAIQGRETKALTGLAMVYVLTDRYEESVNHFDRAVELGAQLSAEEQIAYTYVELVCNRAEMQESEFDDLEDYLCFAHFQKLKLWTPAILN